jgi:hypothetical protein
MYTIKTKLQEEALQWAKYLDNMMRRGYYNDADEMPLPPIEGFPYIDNRKYRPIWNKYVDDDISDYYMLEDGISAKDIIFGPSNEKHEDKIDDEYILLGRGADNYFGYTISRPAEVIAIGKTYKFIDLNLPLFNTSFYETHFCGEDLGNFNDELNAFNTIEEYIGQTFLEDVYVGKYKSFTMFSTVEDVFTIDEVYPDTVY